MDERLEIYCNQCLQVKVLKRPYAIFKIKIAYGPLFLVSELDVAHSQALDNEP